MTTNPTDNLPSLSSTAIQPSVSPKLDILPNQLIRQHKAQDRRMYADNDIPHISELDVRSIVDAAGSHKRNGDRDALLVATLFDGALRCKEALGIRPSDIIRDAPGYFVQNVEGKSYKGQTRIRRVAISESLASKLITYAYEKNIPKTERIFRVGRARVHQIVAALMVECKIVKPDHVGSVHVLRHSGALERLRKTGNPKALQDQLGHTNAEMTIHYMKTLSKEETLRIQQGVDFGW